MKAVILDKISQELSNGINTEPKALYLLAEIRKYIDGYNRAEKNKYPNLYFYCDWVLHIKMDRIPTKIILARFESLFSNINDLKEISNIFKKQERNFYLLVDLKEELRNFLTVNGLPTDLIENNGR